MLLMDRLAVTGRRVQYSSCLRKTAAERVPINPAHGPASGLTPKCAVPLACPGARRVLDSGQSPAGRGKGGSPGSPTSCHGHLGSGITRSCIEIFLELGNFYTAWGPSQFQISIRQKPKVLKVVSHGQPSLRASAAYIALCMQHIDFTWKHQRRSTDRWWYS